MGGDESETPTSFQFAQLLYLDGRFLAITRLQSHLGYLDPASGVFEPLGRGGWGSGQLYYQETADIVYIAERSVRGNFWRYDFATNEAIPFMNHTLDIIATSAEDDEYIYFVTRNTPSGILRIRKPD